MEFVRFKDSSSTNYASDDDMEDLVPEDLLFAWNSNAIELSYNAHHCNHYPSSLPVSLVDKTLSYRFEIMTPRMPRTAGVNNPFIESWFPVSLTDNSVFSSLIMSSLTHRRTLWLISGRSMEPFELEEEQLLEDSYKDSVKTLNNRMKDPVTAVTDTTILAVFMMIEKPISSLGKDWKKESPFSAPLQELQWLNIHGAREPNIPHQQGLCKLVELRGGLGNIELPGLAAAISYRVLVNATLTLSAPSLPFFPLSGNHNLQLQDIIYSNIFPIQLSKLYSVGFTQDLVEAFQASASYTSTLQRYVSGETSHLDTQAMCDQRNLLQHRILSLPAAQYLTESRGLYDVCRISLMMYSIGVTFPLPGVGAPFIPLSTKLKAQLQSLDLESIVALVPDSSPLVLWVLTMGCIAAMDSAEWPWFVAALSKHNASTQIFDWNQYKQELKKVLWLDSACDMAGKLLWREVQLFKQFEEFVPSPTHLLPSSTTHPDLIETKAPCRHCRARKLKCDKKVPCHNCMKGDLLCSSFIETEAVNPVRVHVYSTRKRPCELCRQRRVKCDKQKPCQNCTKGCYTCSYS